MAHDKVRNTYSCYATSKYIPNNNVNDIKFNMLILIVSIKYIILLYVRMII